MDWKRYAFAHAGVQPARCAGRLRPAAPAGRAAAESAGLGAVSPDSSFNTAISFATNTNWQGYGGESTMSYLTQMLGLAVQNFVSAATGMAVLVAFIRGFVRKQSNGTRQFLGRPDAVDAVRAAAAVAGAVAGTGVAGRGPELQSGGRRAADAVGRGGHTGQGRRAGEEGDDHRRRACRKGRRHRRWPSSSSAPTAAASSTSTRRIPTRTRHRCRTSSKCWQSC